MRANQYLPFPVARNFPRHDFYASSPHVVSFPKSVQRGIQCGIACSLFDVIMELQSNTFSDVDVRNQCISVLTLIGIRKRNSCTVFLDRYGAEGRCFDSLGVDHYNACVSINGIFVDISETTAIVIVNHYSKVGHIANVFKILTRSVTDEGEHVIVLVN